MYIWILGNRDNFNILFVQLFSANSSGNFLHGIFYFCDQRILLKYIFV